MDYVIDYEFRTIVAFECDTMVLDFSAPPCTAAMPAFNDDYAFEPARLPAEAFQYSSYMQRYGVSKAQAKRIVQRIKLERVFLSPLFQANLTPF